MPAQTCGDSLETSTILTGHMISFALYDTLTGRISDRSVIQIEKAIPMNIIHSVNFVILKKTYKKRQSKRQETTELNNETATSQVSGL